MPYNYNTSYNYTPLTLDQFTGQTNTVGQFQDFAKWLAQQGIDFANLVRADKNTQLAVQNAFQQQQADRAYGLSQQQFQMNKTAQDIQNAIAKQNATDTYWANARSSLDNNPAYQQMLAQNAAARQKRLAESAAFTVPYYGISGRQNPIVFAPAGGTSTHYKA